MIGLMRHALGTWPARLFFGLLVVVFVIWGIGDVFRNGFGDDAAVATVAGKSVDINEVSETYRRQLSQLSRALGTDITPTLPMKKGIADRALEEVITQTALQAEVESLGLIASDEAVRQAVYDIPNFHGRDGKFDRLQFQSVLTSNGLTEAHFLDMVRKDLGQKQLMGAIRAGSLSPDVLTRTVYAFQNETRIADTVAFPFAAVPKPAPATDAQATRWYENHKDLYSTPEYRRVKLVVLSPDTVAGDISIAEDDIRAAYEAHKAEYVVTEKRTVQVVLEQDEAKALALAGVWNSGADWATIQKAADADGAAAIELTDATPDLLPVAELAQAAFAAPLNAVPAPVKSAMGWHVLKVTGISGGTSKTLADLHDTLRARLVADKAADLIYERANKLDDLMSGGAKLDELPADYGLAAVSGTLDAQGLTTDGNPAPLPGTDALHQVLIGAIFAARVGDPPHLVEAPRQPGTEQTFYALNLEEVIPPAPRPQAEVATRVAADIVQDNVRHTQEAAAAALLATVKGGKSLGDAAAAAGLKVTRLPAIGRASPVAGVPVQLTQPLFTLKSGEPTMVETEDGFIVATLAQIVAANPDADVIAFGKMRDALAIGVADDLQAQFVLALRDRGQPRINRTVADRLVQPDN